jgi:biopolymer transport protein ExbB
MLNFLLATAAGNAATPIAPGAGTADGGSGGAGASSIRIWDYINDGGILSYVLIGLSILAVASIVYNILEIRRSRQAPPIVLGHLQRLFGDGDYEGAHELCLAQTSDSLLTSIVGSALGRCLSSPFGIMEFREAVESAAPPEVDRLHRNNDWLGILAAIGPMLGLLGTVIGMIGAFRTIGTLSGAQRSNELATFMSMALVNTAEGLIVAIPCTVAFALFRRRIDQIVDEVGGHIERLAAMTQAPQSRSAAGHAPGQAAGRETNSAGARA